MPRRKSLPLLRGARGLRREDILKAQLASINAAMALLTIVNHRAAFLRHLSRELTRKLPIVGGITLESSVARFEFRQWHTRIPAT